LPPASAKRRGATRVAASILCAALAACFRSQGLLVPIVAVVVGAGLARPDTSARLAVFAVSVAAALALLAAGSRFGASDSDQASVVFVPKTLFCNHLNIVLASDAARREIVSAAGDRADATMARLAADFAAEPGRWPVLGFFGDACLFDSALDRDVADGTGNAVGAAAAYQRIFLAAVRDRPLAYAGKFVRQMAYGASVAWPPYGLDPVIPVSTDDVPHVSDILTRHGRAAQPIDLQGGPVRIGLLSDLPGISAYLFRALSTAFGYRRHILDGDRCAASAPQVRDARRDRDRDVGDFDRDRRRRPHPRRLAISGSRSADGGHHAVPFRRRTGRNDRMPAEGLIAPLASSHAQNGRGIQHMQLQSQRTRHQQLVRCGLGNGGIARADQNRKRTRYARSEFCRS